MIKYMYPLAFLVLSLIFPWHAHAFDKTPLNPEFVKWRDSLNAPVREMNVLEATPSHPPLTGRPSPVNREHLLDKSIVPQTNIAIGRAVPVVTDTTYDLRSLGFVTPVRNQDPYGTCWTFAAMGSSESSTLKQGGTSDDYSEKHLAYYGYTNIDSNYVSFDIHSPGSGVYDQGGNDDISTAMFSRGTGIVAEATVPYGSETTPPADAANTKRLVHTHFAPGGANVVNNIKYLLKTYGAVSTIYHHDDAFLDTETGGYYRNTDTTTNHLVTTVGWDDNFSKTNFKTQPTNDGAWIVKNSWGDDWGTTWGGTWNGNGYFYISYEDTSVIHHGATAFQTGPVLDGRHVYMHDPLGRIWNIGAQDGDEWMANMFTATASHRLEQVALFTAVIDTTVDVYIIKNAKFENNDIAGDVVQYSGSPVLVSQTFIAPGYHTLDLPASVPVSAGEAFAIAIRVRAASTEYLLPTEAPMANWSSKATASAGESFYSDDGNTWQDLTTMGGDFVNANFCVRAFAVPGGSVAPINMLLLN